MVRTRRPRLARLTDDPGYARILSRLLTDQRDTTILTGAQLDEAARITPADIRAAVRLWNAAQRRAGTDLEGQL